MFKKLLLSLSIAVAATGALAKEVTIQTARGEVTLESSPKKIAVFDVGVIDTLQALDVSIAGIPDILKTVPYLKPTVEHAKNMGTVFVPNLEELNAADLDLIIVGARTASKLDDVKKVSNAIDMSAAGDNLVDSGLRNIDNLGKLFDKEEKAATLHKDIATLVEQTQAAVKGKGKGLLVMVNGSKITLMGQNDRLGWIHTVLGVPAADPNLKAPEHGKKPEGAKGEKPKEGEKATAGNHGQATSFELVQKLNPDWLFVLDRTAAIGEKGESAAVVLDNELVRETNAWKNGNVIYLSSAAYIAPGGYEQLKTDLTTIKNAFEKK